MADPLDDLRRAWRSVEAPPPADDLAEADPQTRETVEWLRAAWATIEPKTEITLPREPRLLDSFVPRTLLPRLAAAILIGLLAGLLWYQPRSTPPVNPVVVPDQPVSDTVQFASLSSEKIEMRSGPVRLVLLTSPRSTADGAEPFEPSENDR